MIFPFNSQDHVCPEFWKHFSDNCYIVKDSVDLSWDDAEERCRNEAAHLVSIRSQEDMDFIHSLIITLKEHATPPLNVFIGKLYVYFLGTLQVLSLIRRS